MSTETSQPSVEATGGWREQWYVRTGAVVLAGTMAVAGFKVAGEIFNSSDMAKVQCGGTPGAPDSSTHGGNIAVGKPTTFRLFDRSQTLDAEVIVRREADAPATFTLDAAVKGVEQAPAQYGHGLVVTSGGAEWTITVDRSGSYMAYGDC